MKYVITFCLTLLLALSACTPAIGADAPESRFGSGELSLDGYYSARADDVRHLDSINGGGVGVGLNYCHTKYLGGAISVTGDHDGSFLDSVSVGVRLRLPIGPIAPYALADIAYSFERLDTAYLLGLGIEYRLSPRAGVFLEGGYEWQDRRDNDVTFKTGVRFRFL